MRIRSSRPFRAYAAIPNSLLRDERLSADARFLISLMMSYSDHWVFDVGHLRRVAGWGREKLQKVMRECEGQGYLYREVQRNDETHRLTGTRWVVIDEPDDPNVPDQIFENRDADSLEIDASGKISAPDLGDADETESVPEEGQKNPMNPRETGFQSLGENPEEMQGKTADSRETGFPSVDKPAPIRRTTLKKIKSTPLTPNRATGRRSRKSAGEGEAEAPAATDEDLARFWAPRVISGRAAGSSAIKPHLARLMLSMGLVQPEQLRAVGVSH